MSRRTVRPLGGFYSRALTLACSIGIALLSIVCLLWLTRSFAGALETRVSGRYGFHRSGDWRTERNATANGEAYVSARTGSDVTGTGSMSAPFATIGYAISETYAGGTVYVAQGVYTENLRLEKALNLLGGYDASNWSARSLAPYSTIINGSGNQHSVLEIEADGEQGSLVEGFTIVHGCRDNGGGIYLVGSAPVSLNTNWILSNTASGDGGGIYVGGSGGAVALSGNTILYNQANHDGGGIYIGRPSGAVALSGNTILYNQTGGTGGGIVITAGVVTAQNDVIADNDCALYRAGVDVLGGTLVARHWTLANNGHFALMTSAGNGSAVLTNTIVAFHDTAGFSGRGIVADYTLSDRNNHCTDGALCTNTFTGTPNYLNPTAGDYHIGAGSAAQDAGVDAGVTTDVDGDLRPACSGYDIGADELMPSAPIARFVSSSPGVVNRPVAFSNATVVTGCADYLWNFGDRLTSTLMSPTHVYTNHGRYTVILTATNSAGTDPFTDTVIIYSPPTSVSITGPPVGIISAAYTLTATVTPPTVTLPITYRWQSTGVSQTHVLSRATDTADFAWHTLGFHAVIVTATNAGGTASRAHVIAITAAHFPFHDDFSSGTLGGGWSVITTNQGRVRVSNNYDPPTPSSDYSVLLDDGVTDQIYSTASLILTIDLTGQNGVVLDFWWRDFGIEPDPQNGVFISSDDGSTWRPVFPFNDGPARFRQELVYLDAEIARYGLDFNDHFQIKFQFFDNRTIEDEDGYAIADVCVRSVPVEHVEISGHSIGGINTGHTFTAVAGPPTATLPITFTWEATDQVTKVQLSDTDITDTVAFAWNTPGMKVITVTASNAAGVASDTHAISLSVGPGGVNIKGLANGVVGQSYSFTAEVSPITTTLPVTYTWEASDWAARVQWGGITDTITFAWNMPGTKVITVTAANAGGTACSIHTISIGVPIKGVTITGSETGTVNTMYTFTAVVSPITAALPISYEWSPPPLTGQGSPIVTYRWSVTGLQTITVTAVNAGGIATDTHAIAIDRHKVYLPLVMKGYCGPGQWCSQNDQNLTGAATVYALVGCDDGTLFVGAKDGIYRRDPGVSRWQREMSVSGSEEVRSLTASSDCALAYAAVLNRGVFRRDGSSWRRVAGSEEGMAQAGTVALAGDKILAGGNFGVRYVRIGEEHNWEKPEFCSNRTVFSLAKSLGQIYASVWGVGVYYCDSDDLVHWFMRNECLTGWDDGLYARYAIGSQTDRVPAFLGTEDGFYRWDPDKQCNPGDCGGWDQKGQTPTLWFVVDRDAVYAAQENGVLRSTDGGETWRQMNTGWETPPSRVYTLLMQTDDEGRQWLYAGTTAGVWRYLLP